jgi:two-component system chemotaxis response regulator CheB
MIVRPTPIVIVSATTAVREVETGMRALRAGALTMRMKPPGPGSAGFDAAARELIETVKAMSDVKVVRHHHRRRMTSTTPPKKKVRRHAPATVDLLAIAASTGGPPALQRLVTALPPSFPAPILVVQHIAPSFADGFAQWLDSAVQIPVKIAEQGERLQPGQVYVAPGGSHLGVSRGRRVDLSEDPPLGGFRPSATHLFRSVAQAYGAGVVAVILTGMGRDGVEGLRDVRRQRGLVLAQDEDSSVVFGMPGEAVAEGLADDVLPVDQIAKFITNLISRGTASAKRDDGVSSI